VNAFKSFDGLIHVSPSVKDEPCRKRAPAPYSTFLPANLRSEK
jgi:hypothetical protein